MDAYRRTSILNTYQRCIYDALVFMDAGPSKHNRTYTVSNKLSTQEYICISMDYTP